MSDPITRKAAIERIVAMAYDHDTTWDLSPKDQQALRHAVQAFSDADALTKENDRLRAELAAQIATVEHFVCGCGDSNCNDCAGARR
jgi:hypothetical protein